MTNHYQVTSRMVSIKQSIQGAVSHRRATPRLAKRPIWRWLFTPRQRVRQFARTTDCLICRSETVQYGWNSRLFSSSVVTTKPLRW